MEALMEQAQNKILKEGYTLVIIQKGEIVHQSKGRGIADLLTIYQETPEILKDAILVDKIIGKAVAVLCVLGKVKSAFGFTMSTSAMTFFKENDFPFTYEVKTEKIMNRMKNGMCPIETSVYDLKDPNEALVAMTNRLAELKSGK